MMSGVRRGYADTPLGQLHYFEAGSGPSLILLHQTPRSADEFVELMPLLAPHFRVVAMDMFGFGLSAKPDGPQTIEQYASGVFALADALDMERFAVLGHHTGSIVAVEVGAADPARVTALVLSSPTLTDPEFRVTQERGPGVDDAERDADGQHLLTWWRQRADFYPKGRTDLMDRFIRDCLAPGVDPLEGHLACARYVMEDRVGLVTAPVLILGAEGDPYSFAYVEPTAAALTAAASVEVRVIQGAMIPVMEHKTGEVAEAVLEFLGRSSSVQVDPRAIP